MKKLKYVTGNWAKILSARQLLEPLGYEVEQIKMDVPEIQDDSIEEVAKFSAKWASDKLKANVIKNDSGLCIEALKGFPGPYTHYAQDTVTEEGVLKLLEGVENRKAFFVEPVVFTYITNGSIAKEKSGKYGWSWDSIFIPEGETKTLGNFDDSVRFSYWNMEGYGKLVKYIEGETK